MRIAARLLSPAALGCSAVALALALTVSAAPAPAFASSSVRLMIDPGHGGSDPGAVGPGLREKDSNLTISRMVERAARRQGWDVAMTRGNDRFVGLAQRPGAAAAFRATDFVSIHSNSTGAAAKGNMTIYRTASGARLGAKIMRELDPLTPYGDIGNRADVRGLAVLRQATMPNAVLVELLSVTARAENAALKDPARQREMAEAVVRGIARYHNVRYYPPAAPKPAPKPAPEPAQPASQPAAAPAEPAPAPAAPATEAASPATATPAPPAAVTTPTPAPETTVAPVATAVIATVPVTPEPVPAAAPASDAPEPLPWPSVAPTTSPWPAETATLTASAPAAAPAPAQGLLSRLASPLTWLFR